MNINNTKIVPGIFSCNIAIINHFENNRSSLMLVVVIQSFLITPGMENSENSVSKFILYVLLYLKLARSDEPISHVDAICC